MLGVIFMISVVTALSAFAQVDVTYNFNQNSVTSVGFTCINSDCSNVTNTPFTFSGSTSNGKITHSYLNPSTANGYAIYFFSEGYVPFKGMINIPNSGNEVLSYNINFYKKSNCAATVDSLSVVNTAYKNEPVQIGVVAALDADTHSAFSLTQSLPKYIPQGFDSHLSVDTQIKVTVVDQTTGITAFTQTQTTSIYANQKSTVNFVWTPTTSNKYVVMVESKATDNQCDASTVLTQNSQKTFTVLSERPKLACYSLVNDLEVSDATPLRNQLLTFNYKKITNEGDASGNLIVKPTAATYKITNVNTGNVTTMTQTLGANSDTVNPTTQSFTFTPPEAGNYTVEVSGKSSSCAYITNYEEKIIMNLSVADNRYNVHFQLKDDTNNNPVVGARVNVFGNGVNIFQTTNGTGQATVKSLSPGTYTYKLTHPKYVTRTGTVIVLDSDVFLFLTMSPGAGETITTPDTVPAAPVVQELLAAPIVIENRLMIKSILIVEEAVRPNEDLQVIVTLKNIGANDLEDIKTSMFSWDLNEHTSAPVVDLNNNQIKSVNMRITVPKDSEKNTFPIRFSIGNSDLRRVIHREIIVR